MIVKFPSRLCSRCRGRGILASQKFTFNTHVLVCPNITKSGKREVMTLRQFNKRMSKLERIARLRQGVKRINESVKSEKSQVDKED